MASKKGQQVKVMALRSFAHRDMDVSRGERVAMEPVEALVASSRGDVSLTVGAKPPTPETPRPVKRGPRPKRRTYRRRDLVPEE